MRTGIQFNFVKDEISYIDTPEKSKDSFWQTQFIELFNSAKDGFFSLKKLDELVEENMPDGTDEKAMTLEDLQVFLEYEEYYETQICPI